MRRRVRERGGTVEIVLSDLFPNQAGIARVQALGDPSTRYRPNPSMRSSAAASSRACAPCPEPSTTSHPTSSGR